jgi:hypothetical protein
MQTKCLSKLIIMQTLVQYNLKLYCKLTSIAMVAPLHDILMVVVKKKLNKVKIDTYIF